MTDYLEQLLQDPEQDAEEQRQTLQWKRPVIPAAGSMPSSFEIPGTAAGLQGAAQTFSFSPGLTAADPDFFADTQRTSAQSASLNAQLQRLSRAVFLSQVRANRPQERSAGADTLSEALSPLSPGRAQGFSNLAALVDTAFARDARRYDGPLHLL